MNEYMSDPLLVLVLLVIVGLILSRIEEHHIEKKILGSGQAHK